MSYERKFNNLAPKVKSKLKELEVEGHIYRDGRVFDIQGEEMPGKFDVKIKPILSYDQLKSYENVSDLKEHQQENGGFVFLFYRFLNDINSQLNPLIKSDISRLMYLSTFISFENNLLSFDNGKELTDTKLAEMLKFKKRAYNDFLKRLVDGGYMEIDNDGNKVLNPLICRYGSLNNYIMKEYELNYTRLFKGSIRSVFENANTRELGKLSTVYLLIPFISIRTNILCHNPTELNVRNIKPMNLSELAEKLNYSDVTVLRKNLQSIKLNGNSVFGFFSLEDDKRTNKVVINPNIIYAGNADDLGAIKVLFL